MCDWTEKTSAMKRERREWETCWGNGVARLGSAFGEIFTDSCAELGAKMSQTSLCGLFKTFLERWKARRAVAENYRMVTIF